MLIEITDQEFNEGDDLVALIQGKLAERNLQQNGELEEGEIPEDMLGISFASCRFNSFERFVLLINYLSTVEQEALPFDTLILKACNIDNTKFGYLVDVLESGFFYLQTFDLSHNKIAINSEWWDGIEMSLGGHIGKSLSINLDHNHIPISVIQKMQNHNIHDADENKLEIEFSCKNNVEIIEPSVVEKLIAHGCLFVRCLERRIRQCVQSSNRQHYNQL